MNTALKYSQGSANQQHNVHLPMQLQKYYEIMKENNRCSIFDENFDEDADNNNSDEMLTKSPESAKLHQLLLQDDGNIIRVSSGRGRGGKNIFFKPGDLRGVSHDYDDHDVTRAIRQIAPLGYGNEITENAVKQYQMKIKLKERKSLPSSSSCSKNTSNNSSPRSSKSLSIIELNSSSVSSDDTEKVPIKPSICELLKTAREECKKLHKKRFQDGIDEETHLKIVEILQQDEDEEYKIKNMAKSNKKISKTITNGCKSRQNVDINSFHEFPRL